MFPNSNSNYHCVVVVVLLLYKQEEGVGEMIKLAKPAGVARMYNPSAGGWGVEGSSSLVHLQARVTESTSSSF